VMPVVRVALDVDDICAMTATEALEIIKKRPEMTQILYCKKVAESMPALKIQSYTRTPMACPNQNSTKKLCQKTSHATMRSRYSLAKSHEEKLYDPCPLRKPESSASASTTTCTRDSFDNLSHLQDTQYRSFQNGVSIDSA
jgi:hypothetical protein